MDELCWWNFAPKTQTFPSSRLHKMSKRQVLKELTPNGFKLAEQFDGLPWQHMMFFKRDDAK